MTKIELFRLPTEPAHQPASADVVKSSSIDYVQIGKPLDIDAIKNLNIKPDETTQTSVGETSNISNQVPPTEPKIEHVDLVREWSKIQKIYLS